MKSNMIISDLKERVDEFSENTTLHGVVELKRGTSAAKQVWVVLMLLVMLVCGFLLEELIRDVMQDPQVTSITVVDPVNVPLVIYPHYSDGHFPYTNPLLPPIDARGMQEVRALLREHNKESGGNISTEDIDVSQLRVNLQKLVFQNELYQASMMFDYSYADWRVARLGPHFKQSPVGQIVSSNDTRLTNFLDVFQIQRLNNVPGTVQSVYAKIVPDSMKEAVKVHTSYLGTEFIPTNVTTVYSSNGPGYTLNVGDDSDDAFWYQESQLSQTALFINCAMLKLTRDTGLVRWGIESKYTQFPELQPSTENAIHCFRVTENLVQIRLETYADQYCQKGIKTTCITGCLLRKARAAKSCVPYLGIPDKRVDVPFCDIATGYIRGEEHRADCAEECKANKYWRPCSAIKVETVVRGFEGPGNWLAPDWTVFTISILYEDGLEHVHLAPKYFMSTILGSVGGIVGIGFGMSIISVAQIVYYCLKTFLRR